MSTVSSEAVGQYQALCESLAIRYVQYPHSAGAWHGAELDDLVQEGMIAVWEALERELQPSKAVIAGRMQNWVKKMLTQRGYGGLEEAEDGYLDPTLSALEQHAYDEWARGEYAD